jgi:hypothetical protein
MQVPLRHNRTNRPALVDSALFDMVKAGISTAVFDNRIMQMSDLSR